MKKKVIIIILSLIFLLIIFNIQLLSYAIEQGIGQLKIVRNSIPITKVLEDKNTPDSIKIQLEFIQKIRQFAIDSLGLKDSKNYTTFYDQKGEKLAYVVQACPKYQIKKYLWHFPIVGDLPYKGFFNEKDALKEEQKLKEKNLDTKIYNPGGWSTLGYFTDPVLSSMLNRKKGFIAELIIHELTHSTIFVKNNSELNENIADFSGEKGAKIFLKSYFGIDSKEYKEYIYLLEDNQKLSQFYLKAAKQLDSLYNSENFLTIKNEIQKDSIKFSFINQLIENIDTINFKMLDNQKIIQSRKDKTNNTFFVSYILYKNKKEIFYQIEKENMELSHVELLNKCVEKLK